MGSAPICAFLLLGIFNYVAKISEVAHVLRGRRVQGSQPIALGMPTALRGEIEAEIQSGA